MVSKKNTGRENIPLKVKVKQSKQNNLRNLVLSKTKKHSTEVLAVNTKEKKNITKKTDLLEDVSETKTS
jgi:hypothetical protein